jgi:PAS domain S-box-containing protein
MSNDRVFVVELLKWLNIKSTKMILVVFSIISLLMLQLFFVSLNYGVRSRQEAVWQMANTKLELKEGNSALAAELQNTYGSSLRYLVSKMEADRFQTIYRLEHTKTLYDQYLNDALAIDEADTLIDEFIALKSLIAAFDLQIAKSINTDGKIIDLLSDRETDTDSLGRFMFETESLGIDADQLDNTSSLMAVIQTQLFNIDHRLGVMITQKMEEKTADRLAAYYVAFSVVFLTLIVLFAFVTVKRLRESIGTLGGILNEIARGVLPDIKVKHEKEFEPIIDSSREIVAYLNDANQFSQHIGEGDFGYSFSPKSENDALGNSLIEMRNRLQEVAKEDKIRIWMNEGQAKFGNILRQHSGDLKALGDTLIQNTAEYLEASLGALFVLEEEDGHEFLELLSSSAYGRKKFDQKKIEIGEGLAGQAFREGKTIYLTDIPTNHYNVASALGESQPTSLLIVPLKEEQRIEGVIEIASLRKFEVHEIEFLESIAQSIASSLHSGKINETTKNLLNETQAKAEAMKAQEEELRQNMEELAATQEQMERRNKELEDIQKRFEQEKILIDTLLQHTEDRVYFKDKEGRYLRVSRSVVDKFHKNQESEVLGKSDFELDNVESAKATQADDRKILRSQESVIETEHTEPLDDGGKAWFYATKRPLKDASGESVGIVGISRDITRQKLIETELQKRDSWLNHFFRSKSESFVVINQYGIVGFATPKLLAQTGRQDIDGLELHHIFSGMDIESFLNAINFDDVRGEEVEIELSTLGDDNEPKAYIVMAGNDQNEDGTFNIYILEK